MHRRQGLNHIQIHELTQKIKFDFLQDYVPDGLSDFAEALANPIKYQSELEKRSEQLAVLLSEDVDTADEDAANSCKNQTFSLSSTDFCYVSIVYS